MSMYFTWLLQGRLGASTYPTDEDDLRELAGRGIGLLVNLHEREHEPDLIARHGLREEHLPVPDFAPPPMTVIERAVQVVEDALEAGDAVTVHCAAGLGRTGTLLACLLVKEGATPREAIDRVRAARPGSIETAAQVARIKEYAARFGR
jgi:atypical dual specificity phosphatase